MEGGRLVLVTGAGGGIGAATARRLGKEGYGVAVTDLGGEAALRVAEGISQEGGEAQAWTLDVTDRSSIEEVVVAAVERFGPLAGWVSNAGVSSMAPFLELSEKDWDFNLAVNAKGVFLCG
jgi:NAD(P)-dependent dehydrogenase (short-subunit alcohol dehydrogenase family)